MAYIFGGTWLSILTPIVRKPKFTGKNPGKIQSYNCAMRRAVHLGFCPILKTAPLRHFKQTFKHIRHHTLLLLTPLLDNGNTPSFAALGPLIMLSPPQQPKTRLKDE